MRIFLSAGEPSGDQHAAHLIRALDARKSGLEFCGLGGPEMQAAGMELVYPLTELAVMGFARVVPKIPKFMAVARKARKYIEDCRPDAVVLVNFPGFNWKIAKVAKQQGIPVFFYLPPQLWAWGPWRVKKVHKWIDHVLCNLRFEEEYYRSKGIAAENVGHPFFDEIAQHQLDGRFLREALVGRPVGILPGSRKHEVTKNFPIQVEIAREIHRRHPNTTFPVACFREEHRDFCADVRARIGRGLPMQLHLHKTSEIIKASECCLMVSGSVSLELMARKTPSAVIYNSGRMLRFFARRMMTCDHMTLPNLIAGREVFPEAMVVGRKDPGVTKLIDTLDGWLSNPQQLADVKAELADMKTQHVRRGATEKTADTILEKLGARRALRAA